MASRKQCRYDEILDKTGEFGRFQIFQCCVLTFVYVAGSFGTYGYMFWAARPDHWCSVDKPEQWNNISSELWKSIILPKEGDGYSKCTYYDINLTSHELTRDVDFNLTNAEEKKCDAWEYDTSQYESTVVTQMNLVCDRFWLRSISQSVFLMAKGAGLLFFGQLADRFGRRKIILVSVPIQALATLALCFTREIYSFIVLRFFQASTLYGVEISAYVIMMEIVGKRWRVIVSSVHMCTWAVSTMALAGIAYLVRDGFYLQIILFTPNVIYIAYYWLVYESPRWLLHKQRYDEFRQLVEKMAKVNGKSLQEVQDITGGKLLENDTDDEEVETVSWKRLCTDPYILFISLVQAFLWFTTSTVYYGLTFNATSLGGNDYLDTFISGAIEVPAYLSVILIYAKLGRKPSALVLFLISAIAVGSTAFIHESLVNVILVVTTTGKFAVTVLFNMVYLYTSELYPTSTRAMGLSISSFFARVGSMLSPFAVDLGEFYPGLPMLLFAGVCILATVSTLALPETRGTTLPQTFDDIKKLPNGIKFSKCNGQAEEHDANSEETEVPNSVPQPCTKV